MDWHHLKLSLPQAAAAAERAVALDSSLAEAHSALAMVRLFYGDYARCELEFLRSLELNPGDVQARIFYGLYYLLWGAGRLDEGLSEVERAVHDDPLSSYARCMLAVAHASSQNADAALENANAALELDPNSFLARMIALTALWQSGDSARSTELGEAWLVASGRHSWAMATLAVIYADWGRLAEAEAFYRELEWRAKREYVTPALLATSALAFDKEAAARYIEEGYARRDPYMICIRRWPLFAALWKQPVFNEIARPLLAEGRLGSAPLRTSYRPRQPLIRFARAFRVRGWRWRMPEQLPTSSCEESLRRLADAIPESSG
jgi:tetratricopeptide (TPR) repeat protein